MVDGEAIPNGAGGPSESVVRILDRLEVDQGPGALQELLQWIVASGSDHESHSQTLLQSSLPAAGRPDSQATGIVAQVESGSSSIEGRVVGPYRLVRELGHGGQGLVYLAEAKNPHRFVALKVLTQGIQDSPLTRLRFEREAEMTGRLSHPGICAIYERGDSEGIPYIAMQYVEGETLDRQLKSSRDKRDTTPRTKKSECHLQFNNAAEVSPSGNDDRAAAPPTTRPIPEGINQILAFFEEIARTLHVAHEAGLVHRDIKPGNIMRSKSGRPVILDFGLAHDVEFDGATLTQSGDVMGTPAYMSPEQIAASRIRIDRRTDIYSLGVTLFECLTLERPFRASSRDALYHQIVFKDTPDPRQLNPEISRDLRVVLEKSLQKDPDHRYPTAHDFAEDLRRLRAHEPILARPIGPITRHRLWCRRSPGWAAALYGFLLMAALTVAVFIWKNDALIAKTSEAQRREHEAEASLAEARRMADVRLAAEARTAMEELWPLGSALPARLAVFESEYGPALDRLGDHERSLAELEQRADAYSEADRLRDHGPALAQIASLKSEISKLDEGLDATSSSNRMEELDDAIEEKSRELSELESSVSLRLTWRYSGETGDYDVWRRQVLSELVSSLRELCDPERGARAEVGRRRARSLALVRATLTESQDSWSACAARVLANTKYAGLKLPPQEGLIPLGPDPRSGFEEFLHWSSHQVGHPFPSRDASGHVPPMDGETGVILVLIPAGSFVMGATSDVKGPNYDPQARWEEGPPHEVTLGAYFLGKHELSRGQWTRLSNARDPSQWTSEISGGRVKPEDYTRHPVEMISWTEATRATRRGGLRLPSEAEWERGCRAGTNTAWHWGDEAGGFLGHANLADESYKNGFASVVTYESGLDDGHAATAPIGTFASNAFGLHDVHGNVLEWCSDAYGPYSAKTPKHPSVSGSVNRVSRGGSFYNPAFYARAAYRNWFAVSVGNDFLGARVARDVTP